MAADQQQQLYEESRRLTYTLGLPLNCQSFIYRILALENKVAALEEAARNAGAPPHLQRVEKRTGYRGQKV